MNTQIKQYLVQNIITLYTTLQDPPSLLNANFDYGGFCNMLGNPCPTPLNVADLSNRYQAAISKLGIGISGATANEGDLIGLSVANLDGTAVKTYGIQSANCTVILRPHIPNIPFPVYLAATLPLSATIGGIAKHVNSLSPSVCLSDAASGGALDTVVTLATSSEAGYRNVWNVLPDGSFVISVDVIPPSSYVYRNARIGVCWPQGSPGTANNAYFAYNGGNDPMTYLIKQYTSIVIQTGSNPNNTPEITTTNLDVNNVIMATANMSTVQLATSSGSDATRGISGTAAVLINGITTGLPDFAAYVDGYGQPVQSTELAGNSSNQGVESGGVLVYPYTSFSSVRISLPTDPSSDEFSVPSLSPLGFRAAVFAPTP